MATEAELIDALRRADAGGDAPAARAIAARIQSLREASRSPQGAPARAGQGAGAGQSSGGPGGIPGLVPGTQLVPSDSTTGTGILTGDESAAERARLGLAAVGVQGYLGLKNNFGKLDAEEQNVLKQSEDDVQRSGTVGKVANFGGQVGAGVAAAMATPVPALARVASPFLKGTLNYLKNAGAAATQEGLTAPAEDQEDILGSKLKRAGIAGATGLGLKGLSDVVQMPVRGMFRATKDAIELMRQGVNPTLQQGADGWIGRFIGGLTTGAFKHGERQGDEIKQALAKRVGQGNVDTDSHQTLNELLDQLESSLGRDRTSLFDKKRLPITNKTREDMLLEADNLKKSGGRGLDQQNEARRVLDDIIGSDTHRATITEPKLQKEYFDRLDQEIGRARDPQVAEALTKAKEILEQKARRGPLKAEEKATLDDINGRLYDLQRMKEAKGSGGELPGFKIKSVVDSWGNQPDSALNATNQELIGPIGRAIGKAPNQNQARSLLVNMARIAGGLGSATAAIKGAPVLAVPYGLSLAGQTAWGAKRLLGQADWQKKATAALDSPQTSQSIEDALRNGIKSDDVSFANLLRAFRDNASNQGASFTGN